MSNIKIAVLGNAQDGGSPHIGCTKPCCSTLFENPDNERKVACLGIIDEANNKRYLIDATPDLPAQLHKLQSLAKDKGEKIIDGIFLTHAHTGHYIGLSYLGKEASNTYKTVIYAMPRMATFLKSNAPWNQLVKNKNIQINPIFNELPMILNDDLKIIPFLVPHRDELSETVGFKIIGSTKKALFIPDIDKWEKWNHNIINEISLVDYAFIDGTFYSGEEINQRDIATIPHPFIIETMNIFGNEKKELKQKIYFTHLNHTNPALNKKSEVTEEIIKAGYNIARYGKQFML